MKRIWKGLSPLARWVLVTLLTLTLTGASVYAYVALTATGTVVVEECLSFVGPNTFSVSLYPQESKVAQLTVANVSTLAISVDLLSTVSPSPGPKGLTVDIPSKITVPGSGQTNVNITITAGKSAEPGSYTVSIMFDR